MEWFTVDFIDYTTEIAAPGEKVFEFFTRIEQWTSWATGIKKASRRAPGSQWGVGFKLSFVPNFLPVPLVAKVLDYHENRLIEWGFDSPVARIAHRFDFEPVGADRCRVRHREHAAGLLGLFSRPLKEALERFDRGLADDLKAACERR